MTNSTTPLPFHADQVGSFLRPENLKKARAAFFAGDLSAAELQQVEDQEIRRLVAKQKELGFQSITDGEFRRGYWHLDFLEALTGVEGYVPETGYNQHFKGDKAPDYNIRVIGKLAFPSSHPFLRHFAFLKTTVETDNPQNALPKATIPSPMMLVRQEIFAKTDEATIATVYPNLEDFYQDLITTYQDAIKAFYQQGCRYLQFDDTNWAFLIDSEKRADLVARGFDLNEVAALCTRILNAVLAAKPDDMTITTHVCRGNHASSWIFSGGYDAIAKNLFATHYDGYFLEYDSDRSGDFAPLKEWQQGRVVLGLVTSKFPELEDEALLKARIQEATAFVPLEQLCLSPQCGFSSTEVGNKLTAEAQWQKMALIQRVAKTIWQ